MWPLSTYLVFRIRGLSPHTSAFFIFYFLFRGDASPQFERLWQGVLREVDSLSSNAGSLVGNSQIAKVHWSNITRPSSHTNIGILEQLLPTTSLSLQEPSLIRYLQDRTTSLTFHPTTMHFFSHLPYLFLLVLSADGLPSRGRWCGTKPCAASVTEMDDPIANPSINNTTILTSVPNEGPPRAPDQWWCGTHPCSRSVKEMEGSHITNPSTNVTTSHTQVSGNGTHRQWWCDTHPCPRMVPIEKRQINSTATDFKTINNSESHGPRPQGHGSGWWCLTNVCRDELH